MKTAVCLATLALVFTTASQASDTNTPLVITPPVINRLAEELRTNHPALKAANARSRAAQSEVAAVRVWEDPMIMVGGLGSDSAMRADEGDILYGVEQKLPLFGKPALARRAAAAGAATEQAAAEASFQALRRDLAKAAFRAALADRLVEIGAEDLRWLETMVQATEERFRVNEASQAQLLRLQNERARRANLLVTERARRNETRAALNRLLARPLDAAWPPMELPPVALSVEYNERLVQMAVRYEPKLGVLRKQALQADATAQLTRRARLPDFTAGIETRNYSGTGDFRQTMFTLSFNLPWANQGKYRRDYERDRSRQEAIEFEAVDYEAGLREEIHHLAIFIENARREAILYRDDIIPRSAKALESALEAWRANRGMLYDVLEARRMWVEAQATQAQAVADQYLMLSELVLCCGLGDLEALQMLATTAEPAKP